MTSGGPGSNRCTSRARPSPPRSRSATSRGRTSSPPPCRTVSRGSSPSDGTRPTDPVGGIRTGSRSSPSGRKRSSSAGGPKGGASGTGSLGALLLGIPDEDGLRYVGKVGTGFSDDGPPSPPQGPAAALRVGRQPLQVAAAGGGGGRRALRPARAGRGGRVRRVDDGGSAPPSDVAGPASRQGARRRRRGMTRGRPSMRGKNQPVVTLEWTA